MYLLWSRGWFISPSLACRQTSYRTEWQDHPRWHKRPLVHGVRLVPGRLYYFTIKSREINPLSPNSDQHQISPGKINVYSIPEVMRIKDTITQDEFS